MRGSIRWLLAGLVFAIALSSLSAAPVRAATVPFHLYGDAGDGWGSTAASQTNPGPTLTVTVGDRVNLTLHSVDGVLHNWFLDLNDDATWDAGEPRTSDFEGTEVATFEFLAPGAGTYRYRCEYHAGTMTGSLVVQAAGGTTPSGDSSLVLYAGLAVAVIVAVVALVMWRMRKTRLATPEDARRNLAETLEKK